MTLEQIKAKMKLYPHDLLSHYQWASWIATVVAVLVLLLTKSVLFAAAAGALTAAAIGFLGERADKKANELAVKNGEKPTRTVSKKDIIWTAMGAIPVSVPLLAAWWLTRN